LTVEGTTKKYKGRASLSRFQPSKKVSTTIIKGLKNFALPFSGFGKHHRCPMLNISTSSHAEAEGGLSLFLFSFLSLFFFLLYLPALYRTKALKHLYFAQKYQRRQARKQAETMPKEMPDQSKLCQAVT
jgi:hypothetical protein